ncbi:uncharacterized protein LOC132559349 [Ylistrum balloti]|uniref:uncharacterized protein LOC132559349 n=1 Tax=Ylistrum balloti TaxID=509963 RepID=UPI002905EFE1|nr:uncharacterized protein LOC132559349 [Ylistrum balloti]
MEKNDKSQNVNFCRLVLYLFSTGCEVLEQVILDEVFNILLADQRNCLERAQSEGGLSSSFPFEKLFPTNGHVPRIDEFDAQVIGKVFHLSPDQKEICEYLRTSGLQQVLSSRRDKMYRYRKNIGEENWDKIDTRKIQVDLKELDVSLLIFVFRNMRDRPGKAWNIMPTKDETSIEDDVCRILIYRNFLAHYRTKRPIKNKNFETIWKDLTRSFKRLSRDPERMEQTSIKMKTNLIDERFEKKVDEWIVDASKNVEKIIRHISMTQEDLCDRVVCQVSDIVKKGTRKNRRLNKTLTRNISKRTKDCIENVVEQLKNERSEILQDSRAAWEMQLKETTKTTRVELEDLIVNSLKSVGNAIQTSISDAVKNGMEEMSTAHSQALQQEVGTTIINSFVTAVHDIEKRVDHLVQDRTVKNIERLLEEHLEKITNFIISTVKEEVISSNKSDILEQIVRYTAVEIKKMAEEENRKNYDSSIEQNVPGSPSNKTDKPPPVVKPTDLMTVVVDTWYIDERDFCQTSAAETVVKYLETNKVVTIIGPPLSGKTMVGRHAALHTRSKNYAVFPISDPNEMKDFLSKEGKQVFVIDDPLGKNSVDLEKLEEWNIFNENLQKFVQNVDVKIIWIMNKEQVSDTAQLMFYEHKVDITTPGLSGDERRRIFLKYQARICLENEGEYGGLLDIATRCNYFFFPSICETFTKYLKWQHTPGNLFLFPFEVLVDYFDNLPRSSNQYSALGLCAVFKQLPFNPQSLQSLVSKEYFGLKCSDVAGITSVLKTMIGIWIKKRGKHFEFANEIYRDAFLFVMGKNSLDPFILIRKMSSWGIRNRVRYDQDYLDQLPDRYVISLEKENWIDLSLRICHDLINMQCQDCQNWRDLQTEDSSREQYQTGVLQLLTNWLECDKLKDNDLLAILKLSLQTENADILDILLEKKQEIINTPFNESPENNAMKIVGFSPLHFAIWRGSHWGVELLLKYEGVNIDILLNGMTPLGLAIKNGNLELVSQLIKYGANLNTPSYEGLYPVHFAIELNNIEIVERLVKAGADMEKTTANGLPPLHFAILNSKTEIVKKLTELQVDVNACNEDGEPPLIFALGQTEPDLHMIKILVNHPGINISSENDHPLYHAVISGNIPLVNILLQSKKMKVNCSDEANTTPLHISVRNNCMEIASMLLTENADPKLKDINGNTPLEIAEKHGDARMIALIKCSMK